MSIDVDWLAVAELKASDEYQRLGVLGRQRALYEAFPAVEAREKALSQRHLEAVLSGVPSTPDPDHNGGDQT